MELCGVSDGRLFIFGLGFSAIAIAGRLMQEGWHVEGTVRDAGKAKDLRAQGIHAHVYDGADALPDLAGALSAASHLLISVPPRGHGDPVLRDYAATIRCVAKNLDWIGYLSTVGVYGDRQGADVDEDSELLPASERGERRVMAEEGWRELAGEADVPLAIFRIAGIYGPGRNQLETVRAGTAKRIIKDGQVFNRIHVEDIATAVIASMRNPPDGVRAYNLADDEPAPPADVVAYAAGLLGIAPPPAIPFEQAELSPMARSFYGESKRVSNARIKTELGVRLKYPSYREGFQALLAQMRSGQAAK